MFTFVREYRGIDAEMFQVLLAENVVQDAAHRLGKAEDSYGVMTAHHRIGKLVLLHAKKPSGTGRCLLTWRGELTPHERNTLLLEVQMLCGGSTYSDGGFEENTTSRDGLLRTVSKNSKPTNGPAQLSVRKEV